MKKPIVFEIIKNMPELYHTIPGEVFSLEKSQVIKWLINQPELQQHIFDFVKNNGLIIYDRENKKWKGVSKK